MKHTIEVCLSPALIDLYTLEGKIVVGVDILRATSVMVTAMAHGAKTIIPVAHLEDMEPYFEQGFLCAAEREGAKLQRFPLSNSPFDYTEERVKGQTIVMTTTNGTRALSQSVAAEEVLIGAFLNLKALARYIGRQHKAVVIHCAGWKGKVNMEDTLFAGALSEALLHTHEPACDAADLALNNFRSAKDHLSDVVKKASHAQRLQRLNIEKDIEYCMQKNLYEVVPALVKGKLQNR